MRKLLLGLLLPFQVLAQNGLTPFKHYPFPTELTSASKGAKIVWAFDELGVNYETFKIVDDTHHWMNWDNAVKVNGAMADYFVRKLKK